MNAKFVLGAMLVLAACGGEKKPAGEAAAPAGEAPAATAAPEAAAPAAGTPAVATADGAEVYGRVCVACHQASGMGVEGAFPPLGGSSWATGKADVPIAIVLHGLQGEIEVSGKKYNNVMAPWGEALNDAEIAAVLTHVRSNFGNSASAVTADEVKAVRAKYTGHASWTAADLKALQ